MELVLRIGRWSLTFFSIAIDEDDGPVVSLGTTHDLAPGFTPPEPFEDD